MFRRLFVAAMVVAMGLSGCGRQVTGLGTQSGTNGFTAGNMLIRFRTAGTPDFNTYQYVIVFNTTGTGREPYANAYAISSFADYSYALAVGSSPGAGVAVSFYQYYPVPGTTAGYTARQLPIPSGLLQFLPNSNGANTEFQLTFNRSLFNVQLPTASSSPAPSATATATTSASASPTAVATSQPPSSLPTNLPGLLYSNPWAINFFVVKNDGTFTPVDAFGATGIADVSFTYTIDVTTHQDNTLVRPLGTSPSGGAPATITGAEVINSP